MNVRAYLELLRFPTVFTAMADILMGSAVAMAPLREGMPSADFLDKPFLLPERLPLLAILMAASCCLYLAGMVLNDYFDRSQDAFERPSRPIPSGRVSLRAAASLGGGLLLAGVGFASAASWQQGGWRPAIVGIAIGACVLAYDAVLKRTVLGPLAMGACRGLNALLGMCLVTGAWQTPHYLIAGGLATFVAGVTAVGRTEAKMSKTIWLVPGLLLMLGGIAIIALFPYFDGLPHRLADRLTMWPLVWLVLGLQTGWRVMRAVIDPQPRQVQAAVRFGIMSLVFFDAIITFAVAGAAAALLVMALLIPTFVLSRWLYVT